MSRNKKKILKEYITQHDVEDIYSTSRLAHLGQKRRSGEEYFSHPKEVANLIRRYYPKDTRAYLVGLLHDTLEDTEKVGNLSKKELKKMISASISDPREFDTIISAVQMLTHERNQPYTEYVLGLVSNPLAFKVKMADMLHNLTSNPSERQKQKYREALKSLEDGNGNIPIISLKHKKDLIQASDATNQNESVLRKLVRCVLRESYGHAWIKGDAKALMLDKEGIEKSDRDNVIRYLQSLGILK